MPSGTVSVRGRLREGAGGSPELPSQEEEEAVPRARRSPCRGATARRAATQPAGGARGSSPGGGESPLRLAGALAPGVASRCTCCRSRSLRAAPPALCPARTVHPASRLSALPVVARAPSRQQGGRSSPAFTAGAAPASPLQLRGREDTARLKSAPPGASPCPEVTARTPDQSLRDGSPPPSLLDEWCALYQARTCLGSARDATPAPRRAGSQAAPGRAGRGGAGCARASSGSPRCFSLRRGWLWERSLPASESPGNQ